MDKFLIRCSSLSKIMTEPKLKADKEAGNLSETAKSYVQDLVRQKVLGYYEPQLGGKEIRKGIMQEQEAINLLNDLWGTMFEKNTTRHSNDWLTGEPDIVDSAMILDIKCPWSKDSMPITEEIARKSAIKSGYDWQMRGYMMLTGKPKAEVCYCLVPTPDELIPPWEQEAEAPGLHDISGVPLEHRVTTIVFMRDEELELLIAKKCEAAQRYAQELIETFHKEHRG